jgi:predicted MPP superfamily phosphohydrolase
LVFPWAIILIYYFYKNFRRLYQQKVKLFIYCLLIFFTALFYYARFVEPYTITVQNISIQTGFEARLAVISDLHLGVYKDEKFLAQVVDQVNKLSNIDAVLIPGDLTYDPPTDFDNLFAPLKNIKFPTYAVLGNHDTGKPGPAIAEQLRQTLEKNGVQVIENSSVKLADKNITLLGLGELWSDQADVSLIEQFKPEDNLVVMAHNPDVISTYHSAIPDITVAGHTHGGQIRLPYIYKMLIPCAGNFDQGLYSTANGQVYVSSGLGETAIPMRLFIPPTIDILDLY